MFWAATRIVVDAQRSTVSARAVYGGQITISTESSSSMATGRNESTNAAASGRVLCIFQLAAQIGLREDIGRRPSLLTADCPGVEQRLDPGQLAPLEELERRSAAGGDPVRLDR